MSMSWVLLSHTLGIFQLQVPINNLLSVTDYFGTFLAQAVVNGYPSVDSFFFISGLLVSTSGKWNLNYVKNEEWNLNCVPFPCPGCLSDLQGA